MLYVSNYFRFTMIKSKLDYFNLTLKEKWVKYNELYTDQQYSTSAFWPNSATKIILNSYVKLLIQAIQNSCTNLHEHLEVKLKVKIVHLLFIITFRQVFKFSHSNELINILSKIIFFSFHFDTNSKFKMNFKTCLLLWHIVTVYLLCILTINLVKYPWFVCFLFTVYTFYFLFSVIY